MSDSLLDFAENDEQTGFRLEKFEVYNWGTFHKQVWCLELGRENTLLTGDIGSGKSTLVDGITTLLVPPGKITFNKAAGAENRERTLRSYVLGHFKSERSEEGLNSRAVALRDHNSYTVILGHFQNIGFGLSVTLAQVFWVKDGGGPPARFFVVADKTLSIASDFSGFGTDITQLKKALREKSGVELFDTYPPYAAAFRRRFGIENEQALDLLNQTISMKSVGNLTEFVRSHMLEPLNPQEKIQALIGHFSDLNQAHQSVLNAKMQIEQLKPLGEQARQLASLSQLHKEYEDDRNSLQGWFSGHKVSLLDKRLTLSAQEESKLLSRIQSLELEQNQQQEQRDELKEAIITNGGQRLERLKGQKDQAEKEGSKRRDKAALMENLCQDLKLALPDTPETFALMGHQVQDKKLQLTQEEDQVQNALTELQVTFRRDNERIQQQQQELSSLRQRPNNIPLDQIKLRQRLCDDLDLSQELFPYAGEILRVKEGHESWTPATERLLRGFALSLLVPDAHYKAVAEMVDRTNLQGRLVYFRIREGTERIRQTPQESSLCHKLQIKPGTPMHDWLDSELARRFDLVCCETQEEFRRERLALTKSGQMKGAGERHEKDDRHRLEDRSRWVLGWTNQDKIKLLEQQLGELKNSQADIAAQMASLDKRRHETKAQGEKTIRLGEIQDWESVDWAATALQVERLRQEIQELEASNSLLKSLEERLKGVENALKEIQDKLSTKGEELGTTRHKITIAQEQREQAQRTLEEKPVAPEASKRLEARFAEQATQAGLSQSLTLEALENRERGLREWLQHKIDNEAKKIKGLEESLIKGMSGFQNRWPLASQELDISLEAVAGWNQLLQQLQGDDLPRFEDKFKKILNENTIREVVGFQSTLKKDQASIKEKIDRINLSLKQIDYHPGRYIRLEIQPTPDPEIKGFYQDLKACTEGTLTGSQNDQYSEAKFLQVKNIIQKLEGREGTTDSDRRWTAKVTDVRQAFVFSASERIRETDEEYEHYSDSSGKSGGQKEKLAYTVLAAALAYQFGLEWNEVKSRSFRFVVIDEAFGRGSDESAHFGMELFRKLRLQVLVVTPLQKIHVIEPFIHSVGFVHNLEGRESRLRNLAIEEYREERDRRRPQEVST